MHDNANTKKRTDDILRAVRNIRAGDLAYSLASVAIAGVVVFFVFWSIRFIVTEIDRSFVDSAELEKNLLTLNVEGYEIIAEKINLEGE